MGKNETYEEFVEKFKPKKTTDDCYTPPEVYEVVKEWACERYGINPDNIVRPFYPGGDYENYEYRDGAVVLDNPPFSILSRIVDFYIEKGIPFFLFAPGMTLFGTMSNRDVNAVIIDSRIIYENGAKVKTNFLTSFGEYAIETSTVLNEAVKIAMHKTKQKKKKQLPKYQFPNELLMVNDCMKIVSKGFDFRVKRDEIQFTRQLDSQREIKKTLYGGAFLLSEKATAEKLEAEKKAAEKKIRFELSEREKEIIKFLK